MILRQAHFGLFLLLLIPSLMSCGPSTPFATAFTSESVAPDFSLKALNSNQETSLGQVRAKGPVLLAFWATWCPSCVDEIPTLNEWYEQYGNKLQILSINVEEKPKTLDEFLKKNPVKYPILMDAEGEVAEKYDLVGLPAVVLVEKNGKIRYYGFSLPENIEAYLN